MSAVIWREWTIWVQEALKMGQAQANTKSAQYFQKTIQSN